MRREIAEKWVAALRSGEYKQTVGQLHQVAGGYCCLGVLCEVAIKENLPLLKQTYDGSVVYDGEKLIMPRKVADWAETDMCPRLGDHLATHLNDGNDDQDIHPHTFNEIADLIEKEFLQ